MGMELELHLAEFYRLRRAAEEIRERARERPLKLSEVKRIADIYNVPMPRLLSQLELEGCEVDYENSIVRLKR